LLLGSVQLFEPKGLERIDENAEVGIDIVVGIRKEKIVLSL
jgi:hypothetical protein